MQAIDLLLNRYSQPKLTTPGPTPEQLEVLKRAAVRVPDHAALCPWRFIVCQGSGLERLGKVFHQVAVQENMSERDQLRASALPLRAPMVMVAINQAQDHEKVPVVEQIASTSCAIYAMQLAAQAQGLDSMWRTGSYAHSAGVKGALGLKPDDEIVGFLYVGTAEGPACQKNAKDPSAYFEYWD